MPAFSQQASLPLFRSPAAARAWGEAQERAGRFQLAGAAYEREAQLYQTRDPQAAEAEMRRAHRLLTDLALAVSVPVPSVTTHGELARLEPRAGCFLGALDEYPGGRTGSADELEQRLGRPLGVAFLYQTYGRPFPLDWARNEARRGRLVQIAWEPQSGLDNVQEGDYLTEWANDAARCGTGVFVRFGGEMNGDWTRWGRNPLGFRRAFRTVAGVLHRLAPNCALVWAPNAVPLANVDAFYPGDDAVDWVGLSLYLPRFYDDNLRRPAFNDNPIAFLDPFYARYAARKPVCLVECGVSRRSRVENTDANPFAAARIHDLLDACRVRFPRLKMLCWFGRDNLTGAVPARRLNDYSFPPGSLALQALADASADPYFLGRVSDRPTLGYARLTENRLPPGYSGAILASVSTYTLQPTLQITRGGVSRTISRPFRFFLPGGSGPVTVRVRDPQGRVAQTVTLSAPPPL